MKIFAPGKLILSGEHSVVHGGPALAMAVDRYVIATATAGFLPGIFLELTDIAYKGRLSWTALRDLKSRLKFKYQNFLDGHNKIRDVLQKPFELAQVASILFFEMLNIKLRMHNSIHLTLQSDIPMGCGMGSSAATIIGVAHAIAHHFEMNVSEELMLKIGLEAENLQHGFSSGIDLRLSLQGGCLFVHGDEIHSRPVPTKNLYLINTGTPQTTTGECVAAAAIHFKKENIKTDFAAVTKLLDQALQDNNLQTAMQAIRENHQLLIEVGVVPERVQNFISEINLKNCAGKICGAGAIAGDNAGIVLAMTENPAGLAKVCASYNYTLLPIKGVTRGVHAVN